MLCTGSSVKMGCYMNDRFYCYPVSKELPVQTEYAVIHSPADLFARLLPLWSIDTCAPRMRGEWSKSNPTCGQCSITAFLAQDIFGGEVWGVPLPDGNYHCFNRVGSVTFDLTSEQFGGKTLDYGYAVPQSRDVHFAKAEKKARYELLKARLLQSLV